MEKEKKHNTIKQEETEWKNIDLTKKIELQLWTIILIMLICIYIGAKVF